MGVFLDADTPWATRFSVKSSHHSDKSCNKFHLSRAMSFCSCSECRTRTFVGLEAHLPTLECCKVKEFIEMHSRDLIPRLLTIIFCG